MNGKLVVTGAGLFGLGALVSWAFTADHFENKSKDTEEQLLRYIGLQQAELSQLYSDKVRASMEPAGWESPSEEAVHAASELPVLDLTEPAEGEDIPESGTIEAVATPDPEISPEAVTTEDEETWEPIEVETPTETESRLRSLISEYAADPDVQQEFVKQALPYDGTPPQIISQAEFAYDEIGEHHSKITLQYYERERVLVDELQEPIPVPEYVGWQALSRFGEQGDDPDVVFVRNFRLLTDFEVERVEDELPIHIRYDMTRDEFNSNVAAGNINLPSSSRDEDSD